MSVLPPVSQAMHEGLGGDGWPVPSNSITFSNLVGGRLPPSLEREDTELLPFLLLHDLPEEPSKSERQLKLERLPPFFDDSETFFFFFLLELVSVCWVVVCFLKLMSHCSSPLEFSSAFSSNSSCRSESSNK